MVVLVVEEWVWTFQAGPLSHLWKHCTMLQLLSSTDENVFKKLVALIWSWLLYYFTQKVVVCLVFTKSYCREIHHSVFVFHTIFVVVSVVKSIIKSITPLHINCVWSSRCYWWGRWNPSPNPSSLHINPSGRQCWWGRWTRTHCLRRWRQTSLICWWRSSDYSW